MELGEQPACMMAALFVAWQKQHTDEMGLIEVDLDEKDKEGDKLIALMRRLQESVAVGSTDSFIDDGRHWVMIFTARKPSRRVIIVTGT
jgi:hypothetical protein